MLRTFLGFIKINCIDKIGKNEYKNNIDWLLVERDLRSDSSPRLTNLHIIYEHKYYLFNRYVRTAEGGPRTSGHGTNQA